MSETVPETGPRQKYLPIQPRTYSLRDIRVIRPHYTIAAFLAQAADGLKSIDSSGKKAETAGLKRNPNLEATKIEVPLEGRTIHPKEIADANFKEMERATALKWCVALNQLFRAKEFRNVPIHNPDGRLKIAIPGCSLGFEIGGILDFFNEQGIPVDIDGVDIDEAGGERKFMKLEEREKARGSKVNFLSQTDARDFYKGKQYDLVVMRHPGFVFELSEYYMWKQIIDVLAQTKPGIIIVSTYNHKLDEDPYYIEEVLGFKDKREVFEGEVIKKLLDDHGFRGTQEYEGSVFDDLLVYPKSPYMIAFDREGDKLIWTLPVDREITIFGSKEYLNQTKQVS